MKRKDLDYLVIVTMLVSGIYVTLTGAAADLLGLHRFAYHRDSGYIFAGLGLLHLILNWRQVRAFLKRRFGRKERSRQSVPVPARPQSASSLGRRGFLISSLTAAGGFAVGRLLPALGRPTMEFPYDADDMGDVYHQWSKTGYSQVLGTILDWGKPPELYKTFTDATRVTLPDPAGYQGLTVEEAIRTRRSLRNYSGEPLSLDALAGLLYAAQGMSTRPWGYRTAPSAGGLYPIELYLVVQDVEGLEPGIYHYAVREHELELLQMGDFRADLSRAAMRQAFLRKANVCLVMSAIFQRMRCEYRERAYRYVLLEAGHIGQNIYLAANSMGLGACAVGAFQDDSLNELLQLDGQDEAALYMVSVGKV